MRLNAGENGEPEPPLLTPNSCPIPVVPLLLPPNWVRPNPKRRNPDPIQIPKSSIKVMMRNVTKEMYGSAIP